MSVDYGQIVSVDSREAVASDIQQQKQIGQDQPEAMVAWQGIR